MPSSGRPRKFFHEGKNDILLFSFSFQIADDATQIDVRKTLYPFCAIKKMPSVMATVANRVPSTVFLKENVKYPVWTCRYPISMILGARFSLILGTQG